MSAPSGPGLLAASDVLRRRETVAVIGAGTIGASWTALFLAHGLEVRVSDPADDVRDTVHAMIEDATPAFAGLGLPTEDLTARLRFVDSVEDALDGAELVQENGPEDIEFKRELWARVEARASETALLLSSTSGIKATAQAKRMEDPGRLVVGHPFNPPHLVPLVEVVPGEQTDPSVLDEAVAFYRALGKEPLVIRKEVPGFVANRLQSALFQECVHLVAEGVVAMDDLDSVVTNSIGLRWAAAGPFLTFHLGGGAGGLEHFLEHLGPGMEGMWKHALGHPDLDDETKATLLGELERSYGTSSIDDLARHRDEQQVAIMRARRDA
ncbi:3-hydroxyacyl-CoA dehydrogenase NAD-binding domain-containing protein [Ilumatobacter sp.]|uniref:3-hydroxyacyl-CoA dehydrogenase NAD-binding domain-containing protein n=1 Tax=Ilumatobacter sp. TaxID=1967498 RepID=UPI003B52A661